jgi:hypothetical protein
LFASPQVNQLAIVLSGITAVRLGLPVPYRSFAADVRHLLAVCCDFVTFDVFIDGFKSVSRYCALKAAGFPVRGVIHVLRDPRSFAASSRRKQVPVRESAQQWSSIHATISRVTRLMGERVINIRYEDLCAAPGEQLGRLQSWMNLKSETLLHPFPPGRHWVGNRSMRAFDGTIALRESWQSELNAAEKAEIERACHKQALRWGYDLSER